MHADNNNNKQERPPQHEDDVGTVNADDPQPDPLGGKSSISDTFAGIFDLSALLRTLCMSVQSLSPSDRSEHELVFLVGEFGGFGPTGCLLTHSSSQQNSIFQPQTLQFPCMCTSLYSLDRLVHTVQQYTYSACSLYSPANKIAFKSDLITWLLLLVDCQVTQFRRKRFKIY